MTTVTNVQNKTVTNNNSSEAADPKKLINETLTLLKTNTPSGTTEEALKVLAASLSPLPNQYVQSNGQVDPAISSAVSGLNSELSKIGSNFRLSLTTNTNGSYQFQVTQLINGQTQVLAPDATLNAILPGNSSSTTTTSTALKQLEAAYGPQMQKAVTKTEQEYTTYLTGDGLNANSDQQTRWFKQQLMENLIQGFTKSQDDKQSDGDGHATGKKGSHAKGSTSNLGSVTSGTTDADGKTPKAPATDVKAGHTTTTTKDEKAKKAAVTATTNDTSTSFKVGGIAVTTADVNALVMLALLQSYQSGQNQLRTMALTVEDTTARQNAMNTTLAADRTALAGAATGSKAYTAANSKLQDDEDLESTLGGDQQLQQLKLQQLAQNQSQLLQMISDFSKNASANSMSIIRNIGG